MKQNISHKTDASLSIASKAIFEEVIIYTKNTKSYLPIFILQIKAYKITGCMFQWMIPWGSPGTKMNSFGYVRQKIVEITFNQKLFWLKMNAVDNWNARVLVTITKDAVTIMLTSTYAIYLSIYILDLN